MHTNFYKIVKQLKSITIITYISVINQLDAQNFVLQ